MALYIPWIWYRLHSDPNDRPTAFGFLAAYGFLAAIGGAGALVLWMLGRRAEREAAALAELRRSLTDPDGPDGDNL